MLKIDFVIPWVDDEDPEWQKLYVEYSKREFGDARPIRFRDWGTLKYWFRGVEQFAPWVNKIHFITCGHYPGWLNLEHPKLNFVKHSDYIPQEYLPTFNANPIELNIHRIKDLAEHFVYFNDDTFIINHIESKRFFRKGLPCDMAVLNSLQPNDDAMNYIMCNDIAFANTFFNKREVLRKNMGKWCNWRYKGYLFRTLTLLAYPSFTGFVDPHLPNAFLKQTLKDVWAVNEEKLNETCKSRFRRFDNVNQYIFRYWQLLQGSFKPINPFDTSLTFSTCNDNNFANILTSLKKRHKSIICINDGNISDFELAKKQLIEVFETIFPTKSQFEL